MPRDCIAICANELPSRLEYSKFPHPAHFISTHKTVPPFTIWCIDCVGPLLPGSRGETRLVTCVCVSSKWVEAWPAHDIKSATIRSLFHANITTRYGVPLVVRSDKGREFLGSFDRYL